jgi:glycosyltransferase involved in cell wall biosynthesis
MINKILIASGSRHTVPPLKHSPGVARIIYTLANHIDRDKYQIRVISKDHLDLAQLDFNTGIFLHPKVNLKTSILKHFLNKMPYRILKKTYGFTQVDRILYYTGLVNLAKQEKPDLVITFMHFELFKMLIKALPNSKHVYFFRSTDLNGRIGKENMRYLIKHSSGFLANTKEPIKELKQFKTISFPTQTIYNSTPEQTKTNRVLVNTRKEIRSKFNITNDTVVIGFAGRFSEEKSLFELFEAIKEKRNRGLNYQILIAGDIKNEKTPNHNYFEKLKNFEAKFLKNAVHWMGWVTHADLHLFYTAIDFAAVLSKYREGNSMFLLEALSYGKPVIATAIGGNQEAITNNKNGFLIQSTSIQKELVAALTHVENNKGMYEEWSQNALAYIQQEHSEQIMINKFNCFLDKIKS